MSTRTTANCAKIGVAIGLAIWASASGCTSYELDEKLPPDPVRFTPVANDLPKFKQVDAATVKVASSEDDLNSKNGYAWLGILTILDHQGLGEEKTVRELQIWTGYYGGTALFIIQPYGSIKVPIKYRKDSFSRDLTWEQTGSGYAHRDSHALNTVYRDHTYVGIEARVYRYDPAWIESRNNKK